ncbi:MAG: DUF4214 domain-containing protein [Cyanobacteria bacterium]|nr:DUF4214 domain-containing protein [Cyanobacteriota bacterium]
MKGIMKQKLFLIFILIFCIFIILSFSFTSKIFAENINVVEGESIQSAVNLALNNSDNIDYINVGAGTFIEQLIMVIPVGQEIHITGSGSDTTTISLPTGITGNVISLDGGGKVFLEGIKVTNGTRSGIRINNSTELNIRNCEISNNKGNIGAGVYNYGSILNIYNSIITNNISNLYGGGIYNDGSLNISNSKIINNKSNLSTGGGIYNAGVLNISNSIIAGNTATNFSGIDTITSLQDNTATNNWWGFDTGPYNLTNNPSGTGNSVADNVNFLPFLTTDPFLPAPPPDNPPQDENIPPDTEPPTTNPPAPPEENNNSGIPAQITPENNPDNSSNGNNNINNTKFSNNNNSNSNHNDFSNQENFPLNNYLNLYNTPSMGFMNLLYNSILEREPDMEGFLYWHNTLKNNFKSASEIAGNLFVSEENIKKIENLDNSDFIKYLYHSILFRKYDPQGYNDWLNFLNSGRSRQDLLQSFFNSDEWLGICANFNIKP